MNVYIESVACNPTEQKELIAAAKSHGVTATYCKGTYCSGWTLEGAEAAVIRFIEENWQVSTVYKTYDELVANGEIGITPLVRR